MATTDTPTTTGPTTAPATEANSAAVEARQRQQSAAEDRRRTAQAVRILGQCGHREAAEAIEGLVAPKERREALLAASRDRAVPDRIRFRRVRPLIEKIDEEEAVEQFGRFLKEVGMAADLLERPGRVFEAQAALRRGNQLRFESRWMAAIERLLWQDRLPAECTRFAEAIALAKASPFGSRASALLRGLTSPLWEKVRGELAGQRVAAQESAESCAENPRSGFSGHKTGKTARDRAKRARRGD